MPGKAKWFGLIGLFAGAAYVVDKYKPRLVPMLPKTGRMRVFPVQGHAGFTQRFDATHPGIDIFANKGTPIVAVADGTIRFQKEKRGGNAAYLIEPDGTQYFYAHMDRFGPQRNGEEVSAGTVIGYVGDTGSAQGRDPHIHFEYKPQGGAKVDPYTELKRVHS